MHFFIHTFNSVWQSNRHSNTNKQTNKQTNVQTNEHIHIKDTYVNNLSRVIVILANYPFKIERKKNTCKFSRWILRRRYIILTLLFGTVKLANMPRQFCNICRWNFEKISIRSQVNSEKPFLAAILNFYDETGSWISKTVYTNVRQYENWKNAAEFWKYLN